MCVLFFWVTKKNIIFFLKKKLYTKKRERKEGWEGKKNMDFRNWWGVEKPQEPLPPAVEKLEKDLYKWKPFGADELGDVDDDYSLEEDEGDGAISMEYDDSDEDEESRINFRKELDNYMREVVANTPDDVPWKRPVYDTLPNGNESFKCQHIESTYAVMTDNSWQRDKYPEVRLFATTERGESVVLRVQSFRPYFYAQIDDPDYAQVIKERLETMLLKQNERSKKNRMNGRYILGFERVQKRSLCGYHRNAPLSNMYKITTALPAHIATCRNSLENGDRAITPGQSIKTYEANVLFELRYMVDHKIAGCQWMDVDLTKVIPVVGTAKVSSCQYEFLCNDPASIRPIEINAKSEIVPIRILSLDIECKRTKSSGFVQATEDPTIVICAELSTTAQNKTLHKACFVYSRNPDHYVDPVPDSITHLFRNEESMLLAFAQYIRECDPDAFTGWNSNGFDWPYLCKRAEVLGIAEEFMDITRIINKSAWLRSNMLRSKAYGAKKINELMCEGRFVYDGLDFMLRGQMDKFRNLTLNEISHVTLGEQKLDVHFSQIPILHEGSDKDRSTLVEYCLKDASLPLRILEKRMAIVNGVEQSRVTGVPLKWLLTKGQGPKTFSKILRTKEGFVVVPSKSPPINNVFTKGGFVRPPIQGFVRHPVATFDFSSLYPSIMQAYNICYSTVESVAWARQNLKPEDYWIPPFIDGVEPDFCFVKEHIQKGVLPTLLTDLLGQRAYVKNLMKTTDKESDLYGIYDGRQTALKVVCNSVYGFLKAFILVDPRLMAAVTAWGQEMIMKTADIIVDMFKDPLKKESYVTDREACEKLGIDYEDYKNASRPVKHCKPVILYGDTDSVVVDFGDIGVQELADIARRVAKVCSDAMVKPNALAFESVKLRVKLYKKKKYCSLEILANEIKPEYNTEMACAKAKISYKGIESKRRDNAKIGAETQQRCLEMILRQGDIKGAEEFVKKTISDVLLDKVDMSKFVITKGLSKTNDEYMKAKAQPAHVILKNKIRNRCKFTGEIEPDAGDRVPFVFIRGSKKEKSTQLAENPVYVQKNGLILDKKYYIMKQIFGACIRIFTCIYEPEKLNSIKSSMSNKQMREFKAFHVLFSSTDKHMLKMKLNNVKVGIGLHTKAEQLCLEPNCRVRLLDPRSVVCESHQLSDAYVHIKADQSALVEAKEKAWKTCFDCAGGRFDVHSCQNMTCDNFFHRNKTVVDVEDIGKVLEQAMEHVTLSCDGTPVRKVENVRVFKPVDIDWSKSEHPELKPVWKKGKKNTRKKKPVVIVPAPPPPAKKREVEEEEEEEVVPPAAAVVPRTSLKQPGLSMFGIITKKKKGEQGAEKGK